MTVDRYFRQTRDFFFFDTRACVCVYRFTCGRLFTGRCCFQLFAARQRPQFQAKDQRGAENVQPELEPNAHVPGRVAGRTGGQEPGADRLGPRPAGQQRVLGRRSLVVGLR